MALPISITLTIIIAYIFVFTKKKSSFLQNSIVFMLIAIAIKNFTTIMTMESKMLKSSEDSVLFIFFLLYRELIIPLSVLIFINAYLLSSSWKKIWICISVLAFMLGVEYLTVRFKVIEYVKWNFIYAAIVEVAYLLIGLGLAKAVLFLQEWESRKHDSRL
jgi:hypothetical protein